MRDWVANVETTHYILGTVAGPHPFPGMVREFQKVIGDEARQQVLDLTGALPDAVVACVGGGSNAIGIFHAFLDDADVELFGVEAGGDGRRDRAARRDDRARAARRAARRPQLPAAGRRRPDHRVALDLGRARLPGRRPRARVARGHRPCRVPAGRPTPRRWRRCACSRRTEGIIPALESAHALAGALEARPRARPDATILVNLSAAATKTWTTAGE